MILTEFWWQDGKTIVLNAEFFELGQFTNLLWNAYQIVVADNQLLFKNENIILDCINVVLNHGKQKSNCFFVIEIKQTLKV